MNNKLLIVDQHKRIAKLFFAEFPFGSVCSQGVARDIALQLPRAINDFRYKPTWKLEDYHTKYGINLLSVKCKHGKTGRDYLLNEEGYRRLWKVYHPPMPIVEPKMTEVPYRDENGYEYMKSVPANQQQQLI